ncbi:MAG: TonB-dependent receptor [Ignavibacteriae bacterium]|nr:TonB-dependent receptor [Ignavibacteriota bacterium]NOG99189.1 TonB-dependent receptor [Ignavibacteriota bacterium]
MNTKLFLILLLLILTTPLPAQNGTGKIEGTVVDAITQEPLPGVNILVLQTNFGGTTDIDGKFEIDNLSVGTYSLRFSFIGYRPIVKTDIVVNSARPVELKVQLKESVIELEGVTVTSGFFEENLTEVNSVKTFSYEEIRRAPGGFEDVVRALSVLPGVAKQSAGRNDLVIRGGAPSENLYLVDGFVVPSINHFGGQGSTGGPLSFINLDYVKETTFSTGGFSAFYGDKLSSVLKIDLRDGRKDRLGGKALISASQFGLNLEGPVSDNSNFIFSIRRSYLDFLFNAAGFNFVPQYYDLLAKYTYDIDNKNKLSYLFVGALDEVKFNNNDDEDIFDNARILGSDQTQYSTGISFRHIFDKGFYNINLSRSYISFDSFQNDTLLNPIFLNKSKEAENQLKADVVIKTNSNSELNFGGSAKLINFDTDILFPDNFVTTFGDTLPVNSLSENINYYKLGLFSSYSAVLFKHLRLNLGVRGDYFNALKNKIYVSPRFSLSYMFNDRTSLNFSTGIYHQFPSYIWLAAFESNKNLNAIRVDQFILGLSHLLDDDIQLKVEGFYKDYKDYPASLTRSYLVLANTGAGFGGAEDNFSSFGLERLVSSGSGFSRGVELSIQKKSAGIPLYGILSLTYSQSKFTALDEIERPGKYDQRWILSFSSGYIFNNKWEASLKFRAASGSRYTPYNFDGTQSIANYLTERLTPTHSLDVRVDRRWDFDGWSLITYIDIQNIYNNKNISSVNWDAKERKAEENEEIGILPSIGISFEF